MPLQLLHARVQVLVLLLLVVLFMTLEREGLKQGEEMYVRPREE